MKIIRLLKTLVTPKIQGTRQAPPKRAVTVSEVPAFREDDEDSYRRSAYN